jgi:signal transduction histidine kinase
VRPDQPGGLPPAADLRRRYRLALVAAITLVPVIAIMQAQSGLVPALGAATVAIALLVLSWSSRETCDALDALERSAAAERRVNEQQRALSVRAAQVTRFYAALSGILEAGGRAREESAFLEELCRICVANTGNHIAFAAWVDEDGRTATVRGRAGEKADAYLAGLQIVLDIEDPRGWGPIGRAVRTGQPFFCNDTNDSALVPWRERVAAAGTQSLSALPLSQGGRIVGAICMHHPYPDAYDEPTTELVGRIAMSASRTLDKLAYERERKRAQAALARANEDLDQRVRERTRELQTTMQELESFSYSVAHDLRAPLRAINAYLQLGADPTMDPAAGREYLNKAAASVASLAELIDDLLEFARAGRRTLDRSLVDMDGLARGVAETLRPAYPGAELVIHPLPPVAGDAFLLRQVLHNLVDNALKFSSHVATPRVEIAAEETAGAYVYRVVDNGVGFDMKYSDNIFGVFQRLHDVRDFGGTGVGLAIVKRIVERHQGRVWCDARPGEGATFSLALAAPETRAAAPTPPLKAPHGNPAG